MVGKVKGIKNEHTIYEIHVKDQQKVQWIKNTKFTNKYFTHTYLHAFKCQCFAKICNRFRLITICQSYRQFKCRYPSHSANIKFRRIFKRNIQFFGIPNWICRYINNIYGDYGIGRVCLWVFDWFKWWILGCIVIISSKSI